MPEYGQSPWEETGNAMAGMGQSMSNLAMARRVGTMRAQQFMQQQAYHNAMLQLAQQKAQQEAQLQQAQIGNYGAEQQLNTAKAGAEQSGQNFANLIGQLRASQGAVNTPSLQDNPDTLNSAAIAMRQAGVLPSGPVAVPRGDFNSLIPQAIVAALSRQAASSPSAAAEVLRGQNVPRGDINYNPATTLTQYGLPPEPKLHEVAPGGNLVDDQGNSLFASPVKPYGGMTFEDRMALEVAKQIMAAKGRVVALGSDAPNTDDMLAFAKNLGVDIGPESTNNPVQTTATRNVGDKVTTTKGTFSWNGQGWDPVSQ